MAAEGRAGGQIETPQSHSNCRKPAADTRELGSVKLISKIPFYLLLLAFGGRKWNKLKKSLHFLLGEDGRCGVLWCAWKMGQLLKIDKTLAEDMHDCVWVFGNHGRADFLLARPPARPLAHPVKAALPRIKQLTLTRRPSDTLLIQFSHSFLFFSPLISFSSHLNHRSCFNPPYSSPAFLSLPSFISPLSGCFSPSVCLVNLNKQAEGKEKREKEQQRKKARKSPCWCYSQQ